MKLIFVHIIEYRVILFRLSTKRIICPYLEALLCILFTLEDEFNVLLLGESPLIHCIFSSNDRVLLRIWSIFPSSASRRRQIALLMLNKSCCNIYTSYVTYILVMKKNCSLYDNVYVQCIINI
jgi:hypothetical protein